MVAVIHKAQLNTGDIAYPISYWSKTEIPKECLHQPWLHSELWSKAGWTICNDAFDFALDRWIAEGKLMWTETAGDAVVLRGKADPMKCPYSNIPGIRAPQLIQNGQIMPLGVPDGTIINPYTE